MKLITKYIIDNQDTNAEMANVSGQTLRKDMFWEIKEEIVYILISEKENC